ncbi:hypothetical protein BBC27_05360 [Acidithiobacillus ferrivorans]|nr:hypothetical protein BBC27_05360 [Acidithiobacillus ferrivorans]
MVELAILKNQATSGFAGIKAPKTNTFKHRLGYQVVNLDAVSTPILDTFARCLTLIVEEDCRVAGAGAEFAATLQEC